MNKEEIKIKLNVRVIGRWNGIDNKSEKPVPLKRECSVKCGCHLFSFFISYVVFFLSTFLLPMLLHFHHFKDYRLILTHSPCPNLPSPHQHFSFLCRLLLCPDNAGWMAWCWSPITKLHSVTFQKTIILVLITVRTPNLSETICVYLLFIINLEGWRMFIKQKGTKHTEEIIYYYGLTWCLVLQWQWTHFASEKYQLLPYVISMDTVITTDSWTHLRLYWSQFNVFYYIKNTNIFGTIKFSIITQSPSTRSPWSIKAIHSMKTFHKVKICKQKIKFPLL
jgi:hypothetical protein